MYSSLSCYRSYCKFTVPVRSSHLNRLFVDIFKHIEMPCSCCYVYILIVVCQIFILVVEQGKHMSAGFSPGFFSARSFPRGTFFPLCIFHVSFNPARFFPLLCFAHRYFPPQYLFKHGIQPNRIKPCQTKLKLKLNVSNVTQSNLT